VDIPKPNPFLRPKAPSALRALRSDGVSTVFSGIEHESITVGKGTILFDPANIYRCTIGRDCTIGPFVEIQAGVVIGDLVKVSSHAFICSGVAIENEVFIGHGVMFTNDNWPRATCIGDHGPRPKGPEDWSLVETLVRYGASIGSGCTILPGVTIGKNAMIGAGSVVTKDVPEGEVWVGNPARFLRVVEISEDFNVAATVVPTP